eukprot:CAMPEP_0174350068 /NCGR_PEP_ID=MMETSP0811_2-20130205/7044_1 /TAXON_ID=73025 ORGANISM="Eutreptiella gymnastica-like, Strain CCMP1594" /NCGR_SAMPLE_ID=MMETSP0811_2 /ASSEMBLY_ACC=CAM_ASM_000667 /LENGTH=38 /DNA_ID= /DNA_START= /DNA_END= /DNA_ORIENTATION=
MVVELQQQGSALMHSENGKRGGQRLGVLAAAWLTCKQK